MHRPLEVDVKRLQVDERLALSDEYNHLLVKLNTWLFHSVLILHKVYFPFYFNTIRYFISLSTGLENIDEIGVGENENIDGELPIKQPY